MGSKSPILIIILLIHCFPLLCLAQKFDFFYFVLQ
ncbi:hypothetical protein LIER_22119 [Lithospermum erythrorhizon]|uniref:Uncharacterized protein n=1 Tax=Lithospermum erythrorhizon TaxID=34254 RepID=A0AAV3QYD5_LITER